jgi:predicted transcriptional regulator
MTANLDENIKRLMKAGFVKVEKKTYEDKSIFIFFYGKL